MDEAHSSPSIKWNPQDHDKSQSRWSNQRYKSRISYHSLKIHQYSNSNALVLNIEEYSSCTMAHGRSDEVSGATAQHIIVHGSNNSQTVVLIHWDSILGHRVNTHTHNWLCLHQNKSEVGLLSLKSLQNYFFFKATGNKSTQLVTQRHKDSCGILCHA